MKKQLIHIHGGESFSSYNDYVAFLEDYHIDTLQKEEVKKWRDRYEEFLGDHWEIIRPRMPSPQNAKYTEWELWFDKYVPFLRNGVVLVGHSLGATFLAEYLSKNTLPLKIGQIHLVSGVDGVLGDFSVGGLDAMKAQCSDIFLYYARDDEIVDFKHFLSFAKKLPEARQIALEHGGHFLIPEFPELIENIKTA